MFLKPGFSFFKEFIIRIKYPYLFTTLVLIIIFIVSINIAATYTQYEPLHTIFVSIASDSVFAVFAIVGLKLILRTYQSEKDKAKNHETFFEIEKRILKLLAQIDILSDPLTFEHARPVSDTQITLGNADRAITDMIRTGKELSRKLSDDNAANQKVLINIRRTIERGLKDVAGLLDQILPLPFDERFIYSLKEPHEKIINYDKFVRNRKLLVHKYQRHPSGKLKSPALQLEEVVYSWNDILREGERYLKLQGEQIRRVNDYIKCNRYPPVED